MTGFITFVQKFLGNLKNTLATPHC